GGRAARLPAAADEDARAAPAGLARQLVGERALPDPRLPLQQEEATPAGEGLVEAGPQLGELGLTPDEGPALVGARLRRAGLGRLEPRILAQDRLVQVAQLAARLDPQLVDQRSARLLVHPERVRLPPRPVQRTHQLPTQTFPQRMPVDERLELSDELWMATRAQVALDPLLQAAKAELLEACGLSGREPVIGEVGQRRPAPERERLGQLPLAVQPAEPLEVELPVLDAESVPRRVRLHALFPEQLPQRRDVHLQRLVRRLRRVVLPEGVEQPVLRDDLVRVQQQDGQERPLLRAAQVDDPVAGDDLQRAEDPELHRASRRLPPDTTEPSAFCLLCKPPALADLYRRIADRWAARGLLRQNEPHGSGSGAKETSVKLSAHLTRLTTLLVLGAAVAGATAVAASARPVDVSDGASGIGQSYLGSAPDTGSVPVPDVIERYAAAHPYGANLSSTGSTEAVRPPDVSDVAAAINGPTQIGLKADGLRLQSMAQAYAESTQAGSSQPVRPPDVQDVADSIRAVPATTSSRDFQWGDYAIGLGSGMGLVLLLAGGLVVGRQQRHRMQTA